MTDDIKLPPLPAGTTSPMIYGAYYCASDMQDYARAAVKADRQRRGEPVAYRLMRNNGNGVWLSDGRVWCEGRPEPSLVRGVEGNPQQWRIEYAYPAPQPAEMEDPNTSPLSSKSPFKTASELIDSINGPANASPTIAYCQHPHCQTTGGCQGPCSKKQSEPVKVPSDAELLTCTGVSKHGDMPAIFGTADIRRFAECILKHFGQRPAEPDEWKLAVDHELTLMQSTADSYPSAKEAVKALINWHVAVATDPVFQQPTEPVDTDLVQKWQREHGVVLTPGTREAAMVVIRHDVDGKPTVWCDPEIADLVRALNDGGVATVASCSGHGHRPGNIMLADGRALVVCKDADEAREVTSHFPGINGEAPQPAEPDYKQLFEQMCERCDALDAKLAEYSEREPVAWQFFDDGRWWNGDVRSKDHRKNTENAGYKTRDLYTAPQPAAPEQVPSEDERAAQGLPPYSPRHLTEEEWNRLTENGRKAWGKKPDEPVRVPPCET